MMDKMLGKFVGTKIVALSKKEAEMEAAKQAL